MERLCETKNTFKNKNRTVKCIVCNDVIINKYLLLSLTKYRCDNCLDKPETRSDKPIVKKN